MLEPRAVHWILLHILSFPDFYPYYIFRPGLNPAESEGHHRPGDAPGHYPGHLAAPQRKSSVIVRHTSGPGPPLPPAPPERLTQFPLAPRYAEQTQEHWIKQLQSLRKTIQ